MWRKIKSFFIFKKLFNYLDSKRKLDIIAYNKKIKTKFGLNLIDYMRFSGKYREEEFGKIREYDSYDNRLLFEGQYSNRKKNGIGKEYDENRKEIFEGEYLDGKRWKGSAKEYYEYNGKLILEYTYLNGIIDGKAKEYDKLNGDLLFEGTYLNGKRNGIGKEYKYIPIETSDNDKYSFLKKENSKCITIFYGEYLNGERFEGSEDDYKEKLI